MQRIRVSRTKATDLNVEANAQVPVESIGASYTHIKTLAGRVRSSTRRIVMYHAMLESLEGLQAADHLQLAYLGFNRIQRFRPVDAQIVCDVLDLAGNPLRSLVHMPQCIELIVSGTLIQDLSGLRDGVQIVRCGHSTHLLSLAGCPSTVKLIECSCAPNLVISQHHLPVQLEELLTDTAHTLHSKL